MRTFTDEEMGQLLANARPYSVVILKQGPNFRDDTAPAVIWEHGAATSGCATTEYWRWCCRSPTGSTYAASRCSRQPSTTPPRS